MHVLATITETEREVLELAGMPGGWLRLLGLALLLAVCYAVVWMYRREGRGGASARLRMLLAALRCTAIVLLAVIWLNPVIARYTERRITASVLVLADVSASMGVFDAVAPQSNEPSAPAPSRIRHVTDLLEANGHDWLKRLAQRNELKLFAFGETTRAVDLPWNEPDTENPAPPTTAPAPPELRAALAAVQNGTDIGQGVATALDETVPSPVAGVIVISDGGFNKGLTVEDAAAHAKRFKAPIYSVGVGAALEPPNARVTALNAPATTPVGDPIELRVELAASGVAAAQLTLEITAQRLDGDAGAAEQRVVARREIELGDDRPTAEARFTVSGDTAGEFLYRAKLATLEGEAVVSDNQREATVLVLDERVRLLIVAGRPSYDYRYLTRLAERDKMINVSCWLQSADARAVRDGNTEITELPRRPEELFEYDAVILMDPNPAGLDSAWAIAVRRLVDEFGGGLLVQAGPHFTSRFLHEPRIEDLVAMLPISPDPEADMRLSEQGAYRMRGYPFDLPAETRGHPLLALHADDETNQAIWAALPGVWWHLPVLREKPLASVLLRHGSRALATGHGKPVLLAVQPFGGGRTAFLGFDNTWRWRATGERFFNQFWVQMVRYLAQARRQGASKRGTIVLDREAYDIGDYAKVEVRVLDASFLPWAAEKIEATLETTGGERQTLTLHALPGREGWFAARVLIEAAGPASIRVPLPEGDEAGTNGSDGDELVKHFHVNRPDRELRSLRLREDNLELLAQRTGGRYVPLESAAALPDWIKRAAQLKITRGNDRPLWDRGWVMLVIAGLLSVEWALRRRRNLL